MAASITYDLKAGGRVLYAFSGLLWGGGGSLILYALLCTARSDRTWLEYAFTLTVLSPIFFFSASCLFKVFQSNPRMVLTDTGFTYSGVFQKRTFYWLNLVSVNYLYSRGGFRWVKILVNSDSGKTKSFKLDFTGLYPDYWHFVKQAQTLSPSTVINFYSAVLRK